MPDPLASDLPSVAEVETQVRRWLDASAEAPVDRDAERLAALLDDPRGLDFTLGVVDKVIRPDDERVAAGNLERLSRRLPKTLPRSLRAAVIAGGGFGMLLPRPIIPTVRATFRRLVRHLVVDATPTRLTRALAGLRQPGVRLDVSLLGPAVLGERDAERRLADLAELLGRSDVDRLTLSVASIAGSVSPWGFDETVERAVERLAPLYERAARGRPTTITLDVERSRDLDLTLAVFTRLLSRPGLVELEAGIALPARFPDSLAALERLTAWARDRVAGGGAGIRVRLADGGSLGLERVDAALHARAVPTWTTRAETEAHLQRMLVRALRPENAGVVRIGVATHDVFDLAFARLLADRREASDRLELELALGMAPELADALAADGGVTLLTPVVDPAEFDAAVSTLVQRLEEAAAPQGPLAALAELDDPVVLVRESARFAASLDAAAGGIPDVPRSADRSRPPVPRAPETFANEPDTDPAVPGNRVWAREVLARAATSTLGTATLAAARADAGQVRDRVGAAAAAGADWGRIAGSGRAEHLDRAGEVLAAFRGRLIEVLVAETGETLAQADGEVSAAIDAAHYYAARARELAGIPGAVFEPVPLTVIAVPDGSPLRDPADRVLAALAAGSAVLLQPASGSGRSAAVLAEALWEAGIRREVIGLVDVADDVASRALVTEPEVDRVLLAPTSGRTAVIVTPGADLDRAVEDLVTGAFGDPRSASTTSLAILVGSVATSQRFRRRLADAVTALATGSPSDPATQVGPLPAPASGAVARALTKLAEGESWLVKPRQLDATDRLWSPGVREVRPGGEAAAAVGAPVLGLMTAPTLAEAIRLQNDVGSGLTAGLQSLDPREIATWLERAEAGDLVVNRATTGARARRRPSGGWKRSTTGPRAAWGGPNALLVLGRWRPEPREPSEELRLDGLDSRVRTTIEAFQPALDFAGFDRVRQAALDDEQAWVHEFGRSHDPSALGIERNVLRYRPAEVVVRLSGGADLADLARVLCAGVRVRARMLVSSAVPLPSGMLPHVDDGSAFGRSPLGILGVQVEDDAAFQARVARGLPAHIRLVGGDPVDLAHATGGSPDVAVWAGAVTGAGRIELLPFVREQSVSITAHRYGIPDRDIAALVI